MVEADDGGFADAAPDLAGLESVNPDSAPAPVAPAAAPALPGGNLNVNDFMKLRAQMKATLAQTPGSPVAREAAGAEAEAEAGPAVGGGAAASAAAPVAAPEAQTVTGGDKVSSWLSSEGAALDAAASDAAGAGDDTPKSAEALRSLRAAEAWKNPDGNPDFLERLKKMSDWVGRVMKKDFSAYRRTGNSESARILNYWKGVCGELLFNPGPKKNEMLLSTFMSKLVPGSLGSDMVTNQRGLLINMFLQTCRDKNQCGISEELLFKQTDVMVRTLAGKAFWRMGGDLAGRVLTAAAVSHRHPTPQITRRSSSASRN